MAEQLRVKIQGETVKLLTLTVRHTDEPLANLIDKLTQSFKELRRLKLWSRNVHAGIAFLEVKRSNGWHPHLHILMISKFIPHSDLRKAWMHITKDSEIVDIRPVKDTDTAVSYVAKYASKPLDPSLIRDRSALEEAIVSLRGRRMVATFGEWRGWRITDRIDETVWVVVESLNDLLAKEDQGDAEAIRILGILRRKGRSEQWDEFQRHDSS